MNTVYAIKFFKTKQVEESWVNQVHEKCHLCSILYNRTYHFVHPFFGFINNLHAFLVSLFIF